MSQTTLEGSVNTPLLQEFPPLLKNRNFKLLWVGYVVSSLADRVHWLVMLQLLCIVILHQKHWDSQPWAQLNLAMFTPFLLLAPLSGIVSDRLPRRAVMISADLARATIVLIARTVLLVGAQTRAFNTGTLLVLLFGSEILLSSVGEFFIVARAAMVPNLVHPRQLLQANSVITAAGTIFSLIGFLVGIALISWSLQFAMYVDAGSYMLSAFCLFLMRFPKGFNVPRAAASKGKSSLGKFVQDARMGGKYLRRHFRPFQAIGLEMIFFAVSAIIFNSLPGILNGRLKLPDWATPCFLAIAGVGMVIGAFAVSRAKQGIPKEIGIAWATVLIGISLLLVSLAAQWPTLLIGLALAAFFGAIMFISVDTLLQRIIPDYVRGRVLAVRDMLVNIGLVSMTIPMALSRHVDAYTQTLLFGVACFTGILGVALVGVYIYYQPLPLPEALARRIVTGYMTVWHRFRRANACLIPGSGPVIVAANHTSTLDPLALGIASPRRRIRFMMAREYYDIPFLRRFFGWVGCIPVNRTGSDAPALRAATEALKAGDVVGVFPEGGISTNKNVSENRSLRPGKPGIAFLALLSGATVVPVYISGMRPHVSVRGDYLGRSKISLYYGSPMRFENLKGSHKNRELLQQVTDQIMAAIAGIRDRVEKVEGLSAEAVSSGPKLVKI
ncbi:MAG TPA: MFS transporter [Phycisphaerae bacterium]|nr:MFS transporter [Phycisphaerae bacterium]